MQEHLKTNLKKSKNILKMLRPGFEPESSARKAEMIGRTTPPEHTNTIMYKLHQIIRKIDFINGAGAEIRTRVPGSTVPEDDHLPYPGK